MIFRLLVGGGGSVYPPLSLAVFDDWLLALLLLLRGALSVRWPDCCVLPACRGDIGR